MDAKSLPYGIAVGVNKGFAVTKIPAKAKPSHSKGKLSKRVQMIREVIREVSGFAPYERRLMELLKVGAFKRAQKFGKKRLGTLKRSKAKRKEMEEVLLQQRKKQHS